MHPSTSTRKRVLARIHAVKVAYYSDSDFKPRLGDLKSKPSMIPDLRFAASACQSAGYQRELYISVFTFRVSSKPLFAWQ